MAMSYDARKPYTKDIIDMISSTWKNQYCRVSMSSDYPVVEDLVFRKKIHTDGIGTKGKLHWKKRTFKDAVQDAMAMNLNDMLAYKSIPYMMNCHVSMPHDDNEALFVIVKELVKECEKRHIAYVGGETSIMNNLEGVEISITMAGYSVEQRENKANVGDYIVGFESSGIHCNGLTLARLVLGEFYEDLTIPTTIYFDDLWYEIYNANAVINVTGGAFTRLKSLLANDIDINIPYWHMLEPQQVFREMVYYGRDEVRVDSYRMYSTFNCGIGLLAFMPKERAIDLVSKKLPFKAAIIGAVTEGNGKAIIESKFTGSTIIIATAFP